MCTLTTIRTPPETEKRSLWCKCQIILMEFTNDKRINPYWSYWGCHFSTFIYDESGNVGLFTDIYDGIKDHIPIHFSPIICHIHDLRPENAFIIWWTTYKAFNTFSSWGFHPISLHTITCWDEIAFSEYSLWVQMSVTAVNWTIINFLPSKCESKSSDF